MIASLGMYDRPEIKAANDRLWSLIAANLKKTGIDAPGHLTRGERAYWDTWLSPDLLLSQTCGLPFRAKLHDKVALVGTPDYAEEGCPPGYYASVIVVHETQASLSHSQIASGTLAFNDPMSQSGWAAVQSFLAQTGTQPRSLLQTGSHAASANAVLEGRADFAAIDAITWRLLSKHEPSLIDLRVIARTEPTPGLPLITAQGQNADLIFDAVDTAIGELAAEDRAELMLRGLVRIPADAYLALPIPQAPKGL